MGIVYEAEQISLGRRVALKVLPMAATMDARRLQRFQNEARAAAQLHHTNIVPVFAVGAERGVHYYAMQYIDGHSLAELIAGLRAGLGQPVPPSAAATVDAADGEALTEFSVSTTNSARASISTLGPASDAGYFRRVAELGVQAAEALDYAHQAGIVHRDIKPANLLLDDQRRLWITDFGLAQVQGDVRMTATGELVGTLRYMSPEQALAKRVVVDHRTDVYSLGATLYELLTLEPVFTGSDRQGVLRQIAFDEPRPPRRLNRAIPAELETVVLKSMEKAPHDRYATAQELADDLRRWLDDLPIRARRPSHVQRLRKWARRHRPLVTAATAVLLLAAVFAGSAGLWWLQKRAGAEAAARAALDEAARLQQEERWPEGLGAVRRAQGVLAVLGADADLRRQADELGKDLEMARRLQEARLQVTALRDGQFDWQAADAAYAEAFGWYGLDVDHLDPRAAGERVRSRGIQGQLVAALDDWAFVRKALGLSGWKRLAEVSRVADADPWRDRLRDTVGGKDLRALEALAASLPSDEELPARAVLLARLADQTPVAARVTAFLHKVQQRHPADFWVNFELGNCLFQLQPPQLEKAISYYRVAVALRPQSAGAHVNLGAALAKTGQLDEAVAECREAIRLQKDFFRAHFNLGVALQNQRRLDEAIAEYRETIRLKKDHPSAHYNLGNALLGKRGQLDEAIAELREAIRLQKDHAEAHYDLGNALRMKHREDEAIAEYREATRLKKDYPDAHYNLGNALRMKHREDEAIAEYREATRLKKDYPDAYNNLGNVLLFKGRLDEAAAAYREAIRLQKDHAEAHNGLGNALRLKGWLDEAIAAYGEAIRLQKHDPNAHLNLGDVLRQKGRLNEAIAECREAIRLKQDCAEAHCNLGAALAAQGRFTESLAAFKQGHELGSRNPRWCYPSAQWVRKAELLADLDARLPALLKGQEQPKDAGERLALAQFCQEHKKLFAASARWYGEAFAEQAALAADPSMGHGYNAACAAALAGCGQGKDADQTEDKERMPLRRQALDWLRADLDAWRRQLEKEPDKARRVVRQHMEHWQHDEDFAGVRGPEALTKLPEAERQEWQTLWREVEVLRQRSSEPANKTFN
jgi:tetratricopeptide (TPR) repeat protein